MREIEFRARLLKRAGDKAKGEWVYGLPQQHVEIGGVPNPNKPPKIGYIVTWEPERGLQSGAPDDDLYWYEIDPQTLGEFTGLLDKNGRRIYEGDIVATGIGPDYVKSIVRIGEGETMGSEYCHSERYYGIYLERSVGLEDILLDGKMLVIGNVWEHPELLK